MSIKNCLITVFGMVLVASYQPMAIAQDLLKRDYGFSIPLPQTGKVTIRKPITNLPAKSLFESCPIKSDLQDFAESTSFLVMICRDRQNDLQKHWIQKNKKSGKISRLTALDLPRSQPVPWKVGDYNLSIYADGLGQINAYLESYNPKTKLGRAEALLYHYSKYYPLK